MKAVQLVEAGEPEEALRLVDLPLPEPGPGEIRVKLRRAALNRRDWWIRKDPGNYQLPQILGSDGAGLVDALGEGVAQPTVGTEVVINPALGWGEREDAPQSGFRILGAPNPGTYAEAVVVPAENVHPRPAAFSWEEAAAFPLAALTAWRALVTRGRLQAGQSVVVTGAGGGAAASLIQIAVALGARVVVTSSDGAKIERARSMGALAGFDYRRGGWSLQVREALGGGADLVVDSAGAAAWPEALRSLRRGGSLVGFGETAGGDAVVSVDRFYFGQFNILGTTMGSPREFAALLEHIEQSSWHPVVDSQFELAEAAAAHRRLDAPDRFGKVVLRISD